MTYTFTSAWMLGFAAFTRNLLASVAQMIELANSIPLVGARLQDHAQAWMQDFPFLHRVPA
ncbi:hypothetical protein LDFHOB_13260 [Candidatus Electronema aureum]